MENKLTYKVVCNLNDKDFYTDDEQEAKKMFQQYITDYGDGIRLYEAVAPEADDEAPEWDIIDSYDEEDDGKEEKYDGPYLRYRDDGGTD